jgi:hypothetical protein
MIRDVHPGSGSLIFYPTGSRIRGQKGTGSRFRILITVKKTHKINRQVRKDVNPAFRLVNLNPSP